MSVYAIRVPALQTDIKACPPRHIRQSGTQHPAACCFFRYDCCSFAVDRPNSCRPNSSGCRVCVLPLRLLRGKNRRPAQFLPRFTHMHCGDRTLFPQSLSHTGSGSATCYAFRARPMRISNCPACCTFRCKNLALSFSLMHSSSAFEMSLFEPLRP